MHHAQAAISITEASDVAEARRAATTLARRLGFDETRTGKVALVVTEAAGNLIKHTTQGGEVVLRSLQSDGISGLEMLGLDRGPGMPNLGECLRDGYSTAGSPGIGLGALVRLPDYFDIYSIPGIGTALLACLWAGPLPQATRPYSLDIGAVCLPIASEHACGDGWAASQGPERTLMLVVDGLGHGPLAAEASREAIRIFDQRSTLPPAAMIEATHAALRHTRGAVMGVAEIDCVRRLVRFSGVGNIGAVVISPEGSYHMVSHNGIVGDSVRRIQEFTYPWPAGALLIMHSDGLTSQWNFDRYPGLSVRHPSLIAGVLYRDFTRGRDDVTVLIARESSPAYHRSSDRRLPLENRSSSFDHCRGGIGR